MEQIKQTVDRKPVQITVICGLSHVDEQNMGFEAARILSELAERFRTEGASVGSMRVLNDVLGKRVGVCDVIER